MRLLPLCLLVVITAVRAVPIEFNACDTDTDCEPSNAVCYDGLGPTDLRRCMCQWGYLWDPVHHRCEWASVLTPTNPSVVVTRLSPLYYQEQLNDSVVATLQFTRGRAVLPDQWFCDPQTQFCIARDLQRGIQVANFNFSLIANVTSNTTGVPGVWQYWRCTNRTAGVRPTRFNDNMIMNATAVALGFGQRPLWEYCPPCATWCIHGTCETDGTCDCDTGWFGDRCDQRNPASPGVWNAYRNCTFENETTACGLNEMCFVDARATNAAGAARGVCWCQVGFVPNTLISSGGCIPAATATTPSVLVDFVPNNAAWRYFNATYAVSAPQYVWLQDQTTLYATLTSAVATPVDPAWRINTSLRLLERCLAASDFIFRPEYAATLSAPVIVLRDRHRWCGFSGCTGVCPAAVSAPCPLTAAQAFAGTCVCRGEAVGRYCDTCAGDATGLACNISRAACRTQFCHGRGDCVDTRPPGTCRCDRPFLADSSCRVSARVCGDSLCSGHGECAEGGAGCVCDPGWDGAACDVAAHTCGALRCSGQGNCTTDEQGCTCNPFQFLSNCSATYCAYNQPTSGVGSCACNASFTGQHCETRKCGMYGDATGPGGACQCFGVMRLDPALGVCSNHICGPPSRGYPVAGTWCTCLEGSRLVQTDTVAQCQKPCSAFGVYQLASDTCVCQAGYTGEFCEFIIVSKLPVQRDLNTVIMWAFTALAVLVTAVAQLSFHLRTDQYHVTQ